MLPDQGIRQAAKIAISKTVEKSAKNALKKTVKIGSWWLLLADFIDLIVYLAVKKTLECNDIIELLGNQ